MASNNRGVAVFRLAVGLFSLFALTVIYIYFDPVMEDNIHADMRQLVTPGGTADTIADRYLTGWQSWVPMFLLAIIIYVVAAGGESNRRPTL